MPLASFTPSLFGQSTEDVDEWVDPDFDFGFGPSPSSGGAAGSSKPGKAKSSRKDASNVSAARDGAAHQNPSGAGTRGGDHAAGGIGSSMGRAMVAQAQDGRLWSDKYAPTNTVC